MKIEAYKNGTLEETIETGINVNIPRIDIRTRKIQKLHKFLDSDKVERVPLNRDFTEINFEADCYSLNDADKLRKIISNIDDLYDEVRFYVQTNRYYRLAKQSSISRYGPADVATGHVLIFVRAVSEQIFEFGTEHNISYSENLTFNGVDYSDNTVLWVPNLAGINEQAADASGKGNTILIYGAKRTITPFGPGLRFNGTVEEYAIKRNFDDFPTTEITILFWMNSSDTKNDGTPISYASSAHTNDFLLYNYKSFTIYRGDASVATGVSANDGKWHRIAVTWRSSDGQIKLYKDGNKLYTGTLAIGTSITAGGALVLAQEQDAVGGGFADHQAFKGDMEDIIVLNIVLSDIEIQDDYNKRKKLLELINNGNIHSTPSQIKITGETEIDLVDQEQIIDDAYSRWIGNYGGTYRSKLAQSVKFTKSNLTKVLFKTSTKVGTPGNIRLTLQTDSAGVPSGTILANTGYMALKTLTTYVLDLPYKVTPNETYWLVWEMEADPGTNNYIWICSSGKTNPYREGVAKVYATAWSDLTDIDFYFRTFYAEHTCNIQLWNEANPDIILELGKESIDQSQEFDDGNWAMKLDAPNDWLGMTWQPSKTKIEKLMVRAKKIGNPGNLRVRLKEYDTVNNEPTGSVLQTAYISPAELSTKKKDIYIPFAYDLLDISKTYIVYFDDDNADASNYWIFYALKTSGITDSNCGRVVWSTDGGVTWSESTTLTGVFKTFYSDPVSCNLPTDAYIQINKKGSGKLDTGDLITIDGIKSWSSIYSFNRIRYNKADGRFIFDATGTGDFSLIYKITSPFPMKNILLKIHAMAEVWMRIEVSTDNSNYTIIYAGVPGKKAISWDVKVPDDFNNKTVLYFKIIYRGGSAYDSLYGFRVQADLNTYPAQIPKIEPGTGIFIQNQNGISSGRAKIELKYNDTYEGG